MSNQSMDHVSYELVSTYAKWCGIRSEQTWIDYHQKNPRPNWVPEDPANFFDQHGEWGGWDAFLGDIQSK